MNNQKQYGQYFTPNKIVNKMLYKIKYTKNNINNVLKKHIMDNSCGDGAFLQEVVKIYIECAKSNNLKTKEIVTDLETYIHGIEIDNKIYKECLNNLNDIVFKELDTNKINWDIKNIDFFSLDFNKYKNNIEYIIGNPPYMRMSNIPNAKDYLKHLKYINGTITDLAYAFTEKSLELINDKGILCYLMPTTFNINKSTINLRNHIINTNLLESFDKINDKDIFDAQTYVGIYVFNKNKEKNNNCVKYNEERNNNIKTYILNYDEIDIDNKFLFAKPEILKCIKMIFNTDNQTIIAKNGLVTTKDSLFVNENCDFKQYSINIAKGSYFNKNKQIWKKCFYPYDKNGNIIPYDELIQIPSIKAFLETNKQTLSTRPDIVKSRSNELFYRYGKSQAIDDTYKNKIIFSKINNGILKGIISPKGTHCLNHIYIINNSDLNFEDIIKKLSFSLTDIYNLNSKEKQFIKYGKSNINLLDIINTICRTQANGYYQIEAKTIEKILNFILVD